MVSAYILPDNRAEAREPHDAGPRDLIHVQPLAGEDRLAQPLPLVVADHPLRRGEQRVLAAGPLLVAIEADRCDIAEGGGGEQQFARPRECRVSDLAAGHELHHRELH